MIIHISVTLGWSCSFFFDKSFFEQNLLVFVFGIIFEPNIFVIVFGCQNIIRSPLKGIADLYK